MLCSLETKSGAWKADRSPLITAITHAREKATFRNQRGRSGEREHEREAGHTFREQELAELASSLEESGVGKGWAERLYAYLTYDGHPACSAQNEYKTLPEAIIATHLYMVFWPSFFSGVMMMYTSAVISGVRLTDTREGIRMASYD